MDQMRIEGVRMTPLKVIANEKGDIYHAMKNSDPGFSGFGEAYFSTVKRSVVKAWKKHFKMTLNLTVPVGAVRFVLYDDRENSVTRGVIDEVVLSLDNYYRLTVPPNIWMGFTGLADGLNLLLNVADIPHDPAEQINIPPETANIPYDWGDEP